MNKPCPFCGSNELSYRISTEDREGIRHECSDTYKIIDEKKWAIARIKYGI